MKKIILLVFCSAIFSSTEGICAAKKAQTKKIEKYTVTLSNELIGKSIKEAQVKLPKPVKQIKCESHYKNICMEKFKSDCTCFNAFNLEPVDDLEVSEITVIVNKDKVVEFKQAYRLAEREIDITKDNAQLTKVVEVAKDVRPSSVYREFSEGNDRRAVSNNIRYYFAKWTASDEKELIGVVWCSESVEDSKLKMDTKFRDCHVKQTILSILRKIDPIEEYTTRDVEY